MISLTRAQLRQLVDDVARHVSEGQHGFMAHETADALIDRVAFGREPKPGVLDESYKITIACRHCGCQTQSLTTCDHCLMDPR